MKILLTTLNAKYVHSNLALRYAFAVAKEHLGLAEAPNQIRSATYQVEMREFTINNDMSYIYNEVIRGNYDLVCFSCYIWNIEKTKEIACWVKQAIPQTIIALGGPEVSFDTESFLRENPWCDYVVRGEGEVPFGYIFDKVRQVASAVEQSAAQAIKEIFSSCPGISYLTKDQESGQKEYIEIPEAEPLHMDQVPFPYEAGKIEQDKVVYYESSRGCPYRCSYCLSSIEKTIRPRSLEKTLDELDFFLKEKVKQVKFIDRTFNFDKKRAYKIWEHLIKNDNGLTNFHFEICSELMNEEIFKLLQSARPGLFQFEIGIQSTNSSALEAVNRHNDLTKITENVKRLVALGNSHVHVDLIAGLPHEDFDSFTKSFDDVYGLGADNLQLGFLKLLKGTAIRAAGPHGFVYRDKAPYEIIKNNYISAHELMKLKMVETVLELYANKEGFASSLKLLINKYGQSPFAFFMNFAEFFFEEGFQNRSHKKEDLYRILYKYVRCKWGDNLLCENYGEAKGVSQDGEGANANFDGDGTNEFVQLAQNTIYSNLEASMNFDAVKKFNKKGWEI